MKILAIETSCDETAAAIINNDHGQLQVETNIVASQVEHNQTGGVVPETAARLHSERIHQIIDRATKGGQLEYDAIAATVGPGLIGSLLIGETIARLLAKLKNKPFYAVNHLAGHVYSAWLEQTPELPALVLLVSGGHTELIYLSNHYQFELLGATRDDAAGEAFDKAARLLGLPYPGGPAIAQAALKGNDQAIDLPIPLAEKDSLEFSFSGLKGALSFWVSKQGSLSEQQVADAAASFQRTVGDILERKLLAALAQKVETKSVIFAGGVSSNQYLRTRLERAVQQHSAAKFYVPSIIYCTDNAAMIGAAGLFKAKLTKIGDDPDQPYAVADWPLDQVRLADA